MLVIISTKYGLKIADHDDDEFRGKMTSLDWHYNLLVEFMHVNDIYWLVMIALLQQVAWQLVIVNCLLKSKWLRISWWYYFTCMILWYNYNIYN